MKFPRFPSPGNSLKRDFTDLLNYVRSTTIRQVQGGRLKQTPNGTTLEVGAEIAGQQPFNAHPFKLLVENDDGTIALKVYHGQVARADYRPDSNGDPIFCTTPVTTTINSNKLAGFPGGGTVGSLSLATSNTYGVWIKYFVRSDSLSTWQTYTPPPGTDTKSATLVEASDTAEIVTSTTRTEEADTYLFIQDTAGYAYRYIGKVAIDAGGVATITQWLKSDVLLPGSLYPQAIASSDASNAIGNGSDGGLYVTLVDVVGGTDIDVTESPTGTFTIDYTGT